MPALRRTPLDDRHRAAGAAMMAFAGWDMPVHYGSVVAEHRAVRERCGVFDLSHLGNLRVTGTGAAACLQLALTNDVDALAVGRAQYTLCLEESGGIVDDLLVYRLPWGYFVVPNAANVTAVRAAIENSAADVGDVGVADVGDDLACLAVQGPQSPAVLADAGIDVDGLTYLDCRPFARDEADEGASGVLARTGYTGERGYEVFCRGEQAGALWDRVVAAGAVPAGLGARDTLRLEMGYPLHGNDISPETSPAEAGLGWSVKPGTGFRGEQAYRRVKETRPRRRLRGLLATGRGVPRAGCLVRSDDGLVGETTSGTFSPTLRLGIALAYLHPDIALGQTVRIDVRGKSVPAEVVRPPFVDADPKR